MRFAWFVLCAACVAAGGCTLNRSISGPGADAGATFDARANDTSVARVDAWVDPAIDGGGGCATTCGEGTVCVDGACVCPAGACCPSCAVGTICNAGVCDPIPPDCGGAAEACCASGAPCESALACISGSCVACGEASGPCCGSACNTGALVCGSTSLCEPCGTEGILCCAGGGCAAPLVCESSGRCATCGGDGDACCAGGVCDGSRGCSGGRCTDSCGGPGEDCCDGDRCSDHHSCVGIFSRMCTHCGRLNEVCCGGACEGTLTCVGLCADL